jgi:putative glutamine amidotransferase
MKPLIGINTNILVSPAKYARIRSLYYEVILSAGGVPILIPPMSDDDLNNLLPKLGGLMLIGGWDYPPRLYGEEPCQAVHQLASEERVEFDLRLVRNALKNLDLPILAICGGLEIVNIFLGGSLIQDIETALPHSTVKHTKPKHFLPGHMNKHRVEFLEGSQLASIYNAKQYDVPTNHHQAIKVLAEGLKATAWAEDGVIEAFEIPERRFTLGVQWHPENDFEGNQALFREFIKQASQQPASSLRRRSGAISEI